MRILLISATDFEIAPLVKKLTFVSTENETLSKYTFGPHEVDVLIGGIGIPFTIFNFSKTLFDNTYDFAIDAGIAGSFIPEIAIGDVVNVIQEQFADIGIEEKGKFTSIFEISLHDKNHYPFVDGILHNKTEIQNKAIQKLKNVIGITVNTVSGTEETIKFLRDIYKPDIETMEGAAFFYVCLMEHIPFTQIRSISNMVEVRDTSKWEIRKAVESLCLQIELVLADFQN